MNINGISNDAQLVAGFADFYNNEPGKIDTLGTKIFYSYGSQSENKDNLGLAIGISLASFVDYNRMSDTLGDIRNSYLISQMITENKPVSYRFYSGWGRANEMFVTVAGFNRYLEQQAIFIANPIKIN